MTLAERFRGAGPAWRQGGSPPVLIRHRSGSVSSRRAYPVAKNPRFVPPRSFENFTDLMSVGEGNDVYLEPEEGVDPESDEAKDRIKRIRNIGEGAEVLKDQEEDDLENKLRTIKEAPSAQIEVIQQDEEIHIRGTGTSGTAQINIGGQLSFGQNGMATVVLEGERGTTGSLSIINCNESKTKILEWKEGQIISQTMEFRVGDCNGSTTTYVPGP
jgi:hypothetical protein